VRTDHTVVVQFAGDHNIVRCFPGGTVDVDYGDEVAREMVVSFDERQAEAILLCLLANWHRLYGDHR
jgi:hypothetical protein